MKRWLLFGIILILVISLTFFGKTQVFPDCFSGEWYSSADQSVFLFEEGIIYCPKHAVMISESEYISGAYTYNRNSILLFVTGIEGLETVQQLYIVENEHESFLCEKKDGTGKVFFLRENK